MARLGSSISGSLLELVISEGFTGAIRGTSQDAKHMSGRLGMTDGEVLGLPEGVLDLFTSKQVRKEQ